MLNIQTQTIIAIIIAVIITVIIWYISYKNYKKSGQIDIRLNLIMNILFPIIVLVILKLSLPTVYLVSQNEKIDEYIMIFKSSFNLDNGEKIMIKSFGSNTVINNTSNTLILETLEYSAYRTSKQYDNNRILIEPFSTQETKSIDYFFGTPPTSISVKRQNQTKKIWLHN
jgi:hypothetical protein